MSFEQSALQGPTRDVSMQEDVLLNIAQVRMIRPADVTQSTTVIAIRSEMAGILYTCAPHLELRPNGVVL